MNDRACLVVLPDGSAKNPDAILEAARSSGLDPNRLRIQLNGRALAAAARGSAKDLAAAAAIAWGRGLYPPASPGEVASVGVAAAAAPALARAVRARSFFVTPGPARAPSPVPWVRRGRAAHVRLRLWPWLALGPAALVFVPQRLCAIGLALAGGVAVGLGLRALSLSEKLRSVAVSKVRSMAMGLVQISGRTAATASLKAPYSRCECVWYRFAVKSRVEYFEGRETWRTISEGSSADMPFLVEDGTGSVLVQPADAEVDVEPDTIAPDDLTLVTEWVLAAGAPVFVTGFAQRRSTDSSEARAVNTAPPDHDDVFVGSGPDVPFTIATRSRGLEQNRLQREALFSVVVGGAYLVAALVLWLAFSPPR
jgi:hypothetical protein